MIPRSGKWGKSFKWACYYMSHDKGADTSERLGFVALHNMHIDETGNGPEDSARAAKMMAFTAMHWEEIQRAHHAALYPNGEKRYRRPPKEPTKPVYSTSLRFHPDDKDKITPELMREAAEGALKVLGLEEHQAVLYGHGYSKAEILKRPELADHPPHIHIIANKIHPVTGRTNSLSNDYTRLSDYALRFGKKHGLVKVAVREKNAAKRQDMRIWKKDNPDKVAAYRKSGRAPDSVDADAVKAPYYTDAPRGDYERMRQSGEDGGKAPDTHVEYQPRFRAYRGRTEQSVRDMRNLQQQADRAELSDQQRQAIARFEARMEKLYQPLRDDVQAEIGERRRTITLEHMGPVFKVITGLKQRLTGQLQHERKTIEALEKTIADLEGRIAEARQELETQLSAARDKVARIHEAELARDEDYFKFLRAVKRTRTKGEAGRKSFNAKRQQPGAKVPDASAIDQIKKAYRASSAPQDASPPPQSEADLEAAYDKPQKKKRWSRKDGRGANRTPARKRKRKRS